MTKRDDGPVLRDPAQLTGDMDAEDWQMVGKAIKDMMLTPGWAIFRARMEAYKREKIEQFLEDDTVERSTIKAYRDATADLIQLAQKIVDTAETMAAENPVPGRKMSTHDIFGGSPSGLALPD